MMGFAVEVLSFTRACSSSSGRRGKGTPWDGRVSECLKGCCAGLDQDNIDIAAGAISDLLKSWNLRFHPEKKARLESDVKGLLSSNRSIR